MAFWRRSDTVEEATSIETMAEGDIAPSRWVGFIDRIDRSRIVGWCFDRQNPAQSLAVEAIGTNGTRQMVIACLFRQDVQEAGHGGHHGFEIDLARMKGAESVTIRLAESGATIGQGPIALDPVHALLTQTLPSEFVQSARLMAAEIAAPEVDPGRPQDEGPIDPRLMSGDDATDPEGLITRFVAQESARILRDAHEFDMVGTIQDRLDVLIWFIGDYAMSRAFSPRVPLSGRQIAALNAPAAIGGAEAAITVALHNFVCRELPGHANLRDPESARQATYWWCVERAPGARLEDRLVTPAQVELLRRESRDLGDECPCNVFMTLYRDRHPDLQALDLATPRDRLALLAYLVLASALRPDLLRFLPRDALRRLLRPGADGVAPLDAILGRFMAPEVAPWAAAAAAAGRDSAGRDLRLRCETRLEAAGLSLGSSPAPSRDATNGAVSLRPGVGILGPFRLASGLGRAARLSYETLAAIEASPPAILAFDLENPAPAAADLQDYPELNAPRAINLLHLNAEAVPLAFAYGPRGLLAGGYNIGFFFWELNEIPPCQRLALDLLDEIWVASEFDREIYARHTARPVIRVGMAAPPLADAAPIPRRDLGLDEASFVFLASFDSLSFVARKNPVAVIEAFRRAFPGGDEPVQLLIKTQNRGQIRDPLQVSTWRRIERAIVIDPRIVLVDETLLTADHLALTRACDCLVSLHRAEGWGFGLVEAMQLGLPVICTGYSGNADFCTPETAFLVDHTLISVASDEYIYVPRGSVWADPSVAVAAAHMRHVVADRADAARKAEAARLFVTRELSLEAVGQRYARRLDTIRADMGRAAA